MGSLVDKFRPEKFVLATHNQEKILQVYSILKGLDITILEARDLGLPEPEENGHSFAENSMIKAKAASEATNLPVVADDSGLCVEAINGDPGIYSARWAGPNKDYEEATQRIIEGIKNSPTPDNFKARMVCCVTLYWPDGSHKVFENDVHGTMVYPGRGDNKFGFQPYFIPEGFTKTAGEMTHQEIEAINHRGKSFRQLKEYLLNLPCKN
jgi:XTP/dITP diphosphohydrolase